VKRNMSGQESPASGEVTLFDPPGPAPSAALPDGQQDGEQNGRA
jgi:hypothetical protein